MCLGSTAESIKKKWMNQSKTTKGIGPSKASQRFQRLQCAECLLPYCIPVQYLHVRHTGTRPLTVYSKRRYELHVAVLILASNVFVIPCLFESANEAVPCKVGQSDCCPGTDRETNCRPGIEYVIVVSVH